MWSGCKMVDVEENNLPYTILVDLGFELRNMISDSSFVEHDKVRLALSDPIWTDFNLPSVALDLHCNVVDESLIVLQIRTSQYQIVRLLYNALAFFETESSLVCKLTTLGCYANNSNASERS